MKSLKSYIFEEESKDEKPVVKFTIWKEPKTKVQWLEDGDPYQKIEYVFKDEENNIVIDFLLGFKGGTWKLWYGKDGAVSYDDEPDYDTKEKKFYKGILAAVEKIYSFIEEVKNDSKKWVKFYINR